MILGQRISSQRVQESLAWPTLKPVYASSRPLIKDFGAKIGLNTFAKFVNQTWTASELCSEHADAANFAE